MPATVPQPIRDAIYNYPPAMAEAMLQLFAQGLPFWLALAFDFNKADAAALFTVPTGNRLFVHRALWEIATGFTGGASSAIGLSSDDASASTKGDILGGASGDVAATLVAGIKGGTLGAKFGSNGVIVLAAGKVIRFDRITSAFTAGVGIAHVQVSLLPTS